MNFDIYLKRGQNRKIINDTLSLSWVNNRMWLLWPNRPNRLHVQPLPKQQTPKWYIQHSLRTSNLSEDFVIVNRSDEGLTLETSAFFFNSFVNTKLLAILSHRRSTTVSLETYPLHQPVEQVQFVAFEKFTSAYDTKLQEKSCHYLLKHRVKTDEIWKACACYL